MLEIILICLFFLLPIVLVVVASELRRKYKELKAENEESPGSVPDSELQKWKWLYRGASFVFWTIIALVVSVPALFYVAISFM